MKLLVTGSQGFIGRNLVSRLSGDYDLLEYPDDIRTDDIQSWADQTDMIIHLAALTNARKSMLYPEEYHETNVRGSHRVFQTGVPTIFASSSSIYEWWQNPYANSKWLSEAISPDDSLGLRFHTVYGPDSRPDMLYDQLQKHTATYLTDHTRDFTHVNDICDAIKLCIENYQEIKYHRAIDVGTARPVNVTDVAEHVWPGNNLPVREQMPNERQGTLADITVLKSWGWQPKHHILD